ncbi:MAG TPA: orotidine-5'-phosphate decarboxylase [Kiritimatiellia bacterium]|nr:orotidine-5'-phosphate decarboxylase [Kiritimatiellia bacterium]HMP97972.1 orotidine-5'-phosphate decarboxylase [Kiritimatiellia bacterium]
MENTAIIVALDVATRSELMDAFKPLPPEIAWYKVGLECFGAEGPNALEPLKSAGKRIFLDLKLHDIPRTVEKAVAAISAHGVDLLTVHASGGPAMLKAAAEAAKSRAGSRPLRLLAVTVLTSLDQADLSAIGVDRNPADHAVALAELAVSCGIDGVVCSVHEAARIRRAVGPEALMVTPGIRLPGEAVGDQKRIATPREAHQAGATHIVVGRPILGSPDPAAAYQAIVRDLKGAA